jgi:hypothetical protein
LKVNFRPFWLLPATQTFPLNGRPHPA